MSFPLRPAWLWSGLLLAFSTWCCARDVAAPTATPVRVENLLLVTIDTLRADVLEDGASRRASTPNLDRLRAAGRSFPQAHAHNVMTLPSHANLLTGLYPYQHGVRDNLGFVLGETVPTAATLLRAAGFTTAAVVGAFPLDSRFGLDRGFELYDDAYPQSSRAGDPTLAERRGDEVVRRGLAWWRERASQRRFLWLHLYDPHAPYAPPEPFAKRHAEHPYLGEVAAVDSFLAPLLEPFLAGREASTLVIVTSDHGEGLGDHGELTHGLFAYESTLRVPLFLWAPGLPRGEDLSPARHVDVLPTMLDAAGLTIPPGLSGRSLLRPPTAKLDTYFEALEANLSRGWAPLRGVIEDGRKLIALPLPELYDLESDPTEQRNLIDDQKPTARELLARLPAESAWPPERGTSSTETEAALRSLGYLGGSAPGKAIYTAADDPKSLVEVDRKIHALIDLYQQRRLEEATVLAREIVAAQHAMGLGYYHLAQVLLERGLVEEAIAVMRQALSRGVATPALVRQLALSLAETEQFQEAVDLLLPLARSGDVDVLNTLAQVLSQGGRQDQANAVLDQVLVRDPDDSIAHETLALVALRRDAWEEARRHAERALGRSPNSAPAWNYLGVALHNLGARRDAVAAWQKAVELDPSDLDVLYNLGLAAAEVGETAVATDALERFIARASPERHREDLARVRPLLSRLKGTR